MSPDIIRERIIQTYKVARERPLRTALAGLAGILVAVVACSPRGGPIDAYPEPQIIEAKIPRPAPLDFEVQYTPQEVRRIENIH